jgi:hypothetical protein
VDRETLPGIELTASAAELVRRGTVFSGQKSKCHRVIRLSAMAIKRTSQEVTPEPPRLKRSRGFVDEVFRLIRSDIVSLRIPPDTHISIDRSHPARHALLNPEQLFD